MRLIDADALSVEVNKSKHDNPHPQGLIRVNHRNEHDHFLRMIYDAPTVDAVEVVRWIPVSERLPERTLPPKDVLVYHDLGCGMFVDRAWYSYDMGKWCSVLGMKLKVTHWMPLPEPPKECE